MGRDPRRARGLVAAGVILLATCFLGCAAKVQAPPEPPSTVRKAEEAFRLREYDRAIELYRTYADLVRRDPYVPRVLYKAALAQYQLGRYEEALATLQDLQDRYPDRRWVQVEALRGDAQKALGHPAAAIHAWDAAFSVARPPDESKLRLRVATVAAALSEEELRDVLATASAKPVREIVTAQLAQREHPEIPEPLPEFAASEGQEPQEQLAQAPEMETGEMAGESVEIPPTPSAEEMSREEVLPQDLKVGVLGVGGSGEDLPGAVALVLGDEHVVAPQAASLAAGWEALAQDPSVAVVIADAGAAAGELAAIARRRALPVVDVSGVEIPPQPYWISAGVPRAAALAALLDYAVTRARLRRFGIVYPDTLEGRQFFHLAQEELARRGAAIVGVDAYAPDAKSLTAGLIRRWRERENLQAVLLSDTASAAATFARFLQAEMPDIPLLGIEDWSGLADLVPNLSGVVFVSPGASGHPEMAVWGEQYRARTGVPPTSAAAVASEAALWLKEVLASLEEPVTRARLWEAMLEPRSISAFGQVVEVRNQRFERRPVVVQFTRGELHEVPPAFAPERGGTEVGSLPHGS